MINEEKSSNNNDIDYQDIDDDKASPISILHFLQWYLKVLYTKKAIQIWSLTCDGKQVENKMNYMEEAKEHFEYIRKFCLKNCFQYDQAKLSEYDDAKKYKNQMIFRYTTHKQ